MALSLHTNVAQLNTFGSLNTAQAGATKSMTRLGTGLRINSSADDAAGLQIATRLNATTRGQQVAMRNTQNATSMMQVADSALNEIGNILLRMKDLATQSADGATSAGDRDALQAEYDALGVEMGNVINNTKFAGQGLFGAAGTPGGTLGASLDFQIGADTAEKMTIDFSAQLTTLDTDIDAVSGQYAAPTPGTAGTEIAGATGAAANAMLDTINTALDSLGAMRSQLGATTNRLSHVYNNLGAMSSANTQAMGRIMDTDYATESANMTKQQMLMQASTAMLKQSGSMSQMAMSLLQ